MRLSFFFHQFARVHTVIHVGKQLINQTSDQCVDPDRTGVILWAEKLPHQALHVQAVQAFQGKEMVVGYL